MSKRIFVHQIGESFDFLLDKEDKWIIFFVGRGLS